MIIPTSSQLFADVYTTEEMREIFSDTSMMQAWLDAESALARAQARLGVIPEDAAREITKRARAEEMPLDRIAEGMAATGHPLMPLIGALAEACENGHGEFVHWGATTQDILDTGTMLQIRQAIELISRDLTSIITSLQKLAAEHRFTMMPGRTHAQHAVPISFGYKVAVWCDEYMRHEEVFEQIKPRLATGNLGGGAGTLASLGDDAEAVRAEYFNELELVAPRVTWHSARDRIAELADFVKRVAATNSKVCNEVKQLQRTEIEEIAEPFVKGAIGSSTMPQKRNPSTSEVTVAISRMIDRLSSYVSESMKQEHERDQATWACEWDGLGNLFAYFGASMRNTSFILGDLQVMKENMKRNLGMSNGLIMSEAVLMKLSSVIGRQKAHDVVYELAMYAYESGTPFLDALLANSEITEAFSKEEITNLLTNYEYYGLSSYFVDAVLEGNSR